MRTAPAADLNLSVGTNVRSYGSAGYYGCAGIVIAIRAVDPKGRFTVRLHATRAEIQCHAADLELDKTTYIGFPTMPDNLTKPDEVLPAPGQAEAEAIRADYETAVSGLQSFVRMGLRLIDVKERLPHGQYMAWCRKHLGGLSHPHLHRAKFIAEGICKMTGIKCLARETFELPPEFLQIIDGKTGYRALLGEIEEFRHDELEDENKKKCEAFWAKNPKSRDDYEPRVLSGELTYTKAMLGMTGVVTTKGHGRGDDNTIGLLKRNIASMPNCWKRWDDLPPQAKLETLSNVGAMIDGAPPVVLAALEKAIAAAKEGIR